MTTSTQKQAGERAQNAGRTPTEYGDRWEPLRSKLSIYEAQYLNTYTRTGDIAALNALVLGIIAQRDELLEACKRIEDQLLSQGWVNQYEGARLQAAIAKAEKAEGRAK